MARRGSPVRDERLDALTRAVHGRHGSRGPKIGDLPHADVIIGQLEIIRDLRESRDPKDLDLADLANTKLYVLFTNMDERMSAVNLGGFLRWIATREEMLGLPPDEEFLAAVRALTVGTADAEVGGRE